MISYYCVLARRQASLWIFEGIITSKIINRSNNFLLTATYSLYYFILFCDKLPTFSYGNLSSHKILWEHGALCSGIKKYPHSGIGAPVRIPALRNRKLSCSQAKSKYPIA